MPNRKSPRPKSPINIGDIVSKAISGAGLNMKQAASLMQIDESQLHKALKEESGLSLDAWRLALLPPRFQMFYAALYIHDFIHADMTARAPSCRLVFREIDQALLQRAV